MVATSSRRAHALLNASGALQDGERLVLNAMLPGAIYSNRELAAMIGKETSFVAGRVNSLVEKGALETVNGYTCPLSRRTVDGRRIKSA